MKRSGSSGTPGRNRHQKAAHKRGETRVRGEEIDELLELSRSDDPADRLVAAKFLCPCHVRRRIEAAWDALYLMLEDPDARVRRQAWHTLEDGGRPEDSRLDDILERALERETDPQTLRFVHQFAEPRRRLESARIERVGRPATKRFGKCDFCGETNVPVEQDLETMIETDSLPRAALACERCG